MSAQLGMRLGILGGGQLGRMLLMAAARLGISATIFTDRPDDPALQLCPSGIVGAYEDLDAVRRFASACHVVTFEFENVPAETAKAAASASRVRPDPSVLAIAQDRLAEKLFANEHGIETAPFEAFEEPAMDAIAQRLGLPFIIKTRRMGYDGKGQFWVHSLKDGLPHPAGRVAGDTLIAEAVVSFAAECSVIGARGLDGSMVTFPVIENVHEAGILRRSVFPAPGVSPAAQEAARQSLITLLMALDYVGVLTAEYFVLADGRVLLNEIAPRVHNSGHGTEIGTLPDQFETHIRAVCGLPLPEPRLLFPTEMINLIGRDGMVTADAAKRQASTRIHLYGREETREGRKMGHLCRPV
jgi:5-(carboxyamino)imidazole ribonucleotide synthase